MSPLPDFFKFTGNSAIIKRLLSMQVISPQPNEYPGSERVEPLPIEPIDPRIIKAFSIFLTKKLKNHNETLLELEKVLTGNYSTETPCILYKRESSDGSVNINGQLLCPFFISCKFWQWPLLVTEKEIDPFRTCPNSYFNKTSTDICINPYHYQKVKTTELTVYVPKICESIDNDVDMTCKEKKLRTPMAADENDAMMVVQNRTISRIENEECDHEHEPTRNLSLHYFPESTPITYTEPNHWCSTSYYEFSERVGETFQASLPAFDIDGFTDPSNAQRFCLGLLSNINRHDHIENVRRHIGRGIRLYYVGGEVFAECMSNSSIFIQSSNCNNRYGWPRKTVCKIPPGSHLKIFNNEEFASDLAQCVNEGFEAAYRLTQMCTIRMSFVKGWGLDYRRQFVTETPCWVEIQLNGPLRWLDRVLTHMGSPHLPCSSMS